MRIFQKLFLLLSLTAIGSALAVAGVLTWNLDRGFSEYLDARDGELLDSFVTDIEATLATQSDSSSPMQSSLALQKSVELMARQGRIRELPPGPPPWKLEDQRENENGVTHRRGPPGPPPDEFGKRLRVFDSSGNILFGPPLASRHLEVGAKSRTILADGKTIGTVRLLPRGPTPRTIDARFIRSQYTGIAIAIVALIVLSALFSWLIAKAGARRIDDLKRTTHALANGELDARVEVEGTDEIAALGEDVNAMAHSLERLENTRRQWLAEISHELRTPLTVLKGELEALKDGVRPIGREAVLSLSEETERLNLLIEDLHFLAMSDLDAAPSNFETLDAIEVIDRMATRFEPSVSAAGLTLEVDYAHPSALAVRWDRHRVEQLLGNLITNSIRYTDAPGRIRLGLSRIGNIVAITVEDSAPGIPQQDREGIFEPLRRLEAARDRETGGSGLGLSVARAIAHAHGGKIEAGESYLGGLKIVVTLPVEAHRK